MTRYDTLFERLDKRDEGAFIPFVMLGDPDPESSLELIHALVDAGADALELGMPFSDPIADGPTIQAAAQRALAAGVTPASCFEILEQFRTSDRDTPVGLLVYANLVYTRGLDDFYGRAEASGVDSVLVADVPARESKPFARAARSAGIAPVLIAAPNSPRSTLEAVARISEGYTYVVTRAGVTGAARAGREDQATLVEQLNALDAPPAIMGFGISRPEQVRRALRAGARGAISGSAVVDRSTNSLDSDGERFASAIDFVAKMKAATRPDHADARCSLSTSPPGG